MRIIILSVILLILSSCSDEFDEKFLLMHEKLISVNEKLSSTQEKLFESQDQLSSMLKEKALAEENLQKLLSDIDTLKAKNDEMFRLNSAFSRKIVETKKKLEALEKAKELEDKEKSKDNQKFINLQTKLPSGGIVNVQLWMERSSGFFEIKVKFSDKLKGYLIDKIKLFTADGRPLRNLDIQRTAKEIYKDKSGANVVRGYHKQLINHQEWKQIDDNSTQVIFGYN